jgi:AcrR family transcriptional regulator
MAQPLVDAGVKAPATERGRRTRARLVTAARKVFEDAGFLDARIADIAETAGVAYGTFYTYFATKEDIFREVALAVQQELLERHDDEEADAPRPRTPIDRLEQANRRYLAAYVRNARIMAVIEQVSTFSAELMEIRRQIRVAFVERSTRSITRWQQEGFADPDLDPYYTASALGSMVDRFAYVWLVLGGDFEFEKSVQTLTKLWAQALDLRTRPRRKAP